MGGERAGTLGRQGSGCYFCVHSAQGESLEKAQEGGQDKPERSVLKFVERATAPTLMSQSSLGPRGGHVTPEG